jgi:2-methylcitrate dehydratase PrpD
MSVLRTLGEYVHRASYEDLPTSAAACAQVRLLDYLGTAFHASCAAPWRPMLKVFGAYNAAEEATLVGERFKLPCAWAAMLNTYPHMSEGSRTAGGHCAWVAMPAALALAERESARRAVSGRELLLAVVLAYEVMLRVGEAVYPVVHERGFHPTTVRGPLGSATVAAKLLGLDAEATVHALSIACSMGGGLEAGATPWPFYCFQTGRATEAGIWAALASGAGLKGNERILEDGFLEAFGGGGEPEQIVAGLGEGQAAIETTYLKLHFGCRHANAPVDTCLDLVREHRLGWHDIEAIEVTTYPTALAVCDRAGARKAAEAIYDIPSMVALAVVHGDLSMRRFTDATVASDPVQEVARRVTLRADPEMEREFPRKWPSAVRLTTRDGRVLSRRRDLPRGEPEDPFTAREVEEKFHTLASSALGEASRRELLGLIQTLPERDSLGDLFELIGRRD